MQILLETMLTANTTTASNVATPNAAQTPPLMTTASALEDAAQLSMQTSMLLPSLSAAAGTGTPTTPSTPSLFAAANAYFGVANNLQSPLSDMPESLYYLHLCKLISILILNFMSF